MHANFEDFLKQIVEGYLFGDIESLKKAGAGPDGNGGCNYPLLMTVIAGIELLGNLVSPEPYKPWKGDLNRARFAEFWEKYVYRGDQTRADAGKWIYDLARNGLAHTFVVGGPIKIAKGERANHLKKKSDRSVYVDASQLADDLRIGYDRLRGDAAGDDSIFPLMRRKLAEMEDWYGERAKEPLESLTKLLPDSPLTDSVNGSGTWTAPAISFRPPPSN
jgi:hypothetical protein